jgi:hypothetical protein
MIKCNSKNWEAWVPQRCRTVNSMYVLASLKYSGLQNKTTDEKGLMDRSMAVHRGHNYSTNSYHSIFNGI